VTIRFTVAELPAIESYILESHPDSRTDAYRWRVWLEESVPLWVELSGPQANETHLPLPELHERLPHALRRYASARLRADEPVLEQLAGWDAPVELAVEHFRTA
jgi:hypothetical protein